MNGEHRAWPAQTARLRLGALTLDLRYRRLARPDGDVELTQRCFDLLCLFLAEPGVLQARDEIFRRVWPGVVVEDANLTTSIWMLRKALGPEAKGWLRTVAKLGYVFEPPGPVEALVETRAAPEAQAAYRPAGSHAVRWLAAVALAACAVAAAHWHARPAAVPQRVLLVAAEADGARDDTRWPAALLRGWVEWKLRAVPSLQVLDAADADVADAREVAVLLSVDRPASKDAPWRVRARFRGEPSMPDIALQATPARLVETIDDASLRILATLAPASAAAAWPALALDEAAAPAYVDGVDALQGHRWRDAAQAFETAAVAAPHFGLVRVLQAQALVELGQQGGAEVAWHAARAWVDALPREAAAPLEALGLALEQRYDEAASAYVALADARPDLAATWRHAAARQWRRAARPDDALALLRGPAPSSPALAAGWMLERAATELANGAPDAARASAAEVERIGARMGYQHERARAGLIDAEARVVAGEPADAARFAAVAQRYTDAKDPLGALRAGLIGATVASDAADVRSRLDTVLAQARAAGNIAVEIDALRRVAFFHYRQGDMSAYRARLAQALDVAAAAGDRVMRRQLAMDLLHQDLLRGDFDALDRGLSAFKAEPAQGLWAAWIGQFESGLEYRRGRYAQALATLARAEAGSGGDDAGPATTAGLACLRGGIALSQGETTQARRAFARCGAAHLPHYELLAGVAEAELDLQGGDAAAARARLAGIEARLAALASTPDRWMLAIELAPVLARSGDTAAAQRLMRELVPLLARAGYAQLEADAHATLAESALADGDRGDARRELKRADALMHADDWYGRRRLRTVAALLAPTPAQTSRELAALDRAARERGDVLGELLAHSLIDRYDDAPACDAGRHARLIAQSGLRGASDTWMLRAAAAPPLASK